MMYYTERENPDLEMARYYQDIPSAMWITLLNLSGECPLCDFTAMGKVSTCFTITVITFRANPSHNLTRSFLPLTCYLVFIYSLTIN